MYRTAAEPKKPRTIVLYGRWLKSPIFLLLFLLPFAFAVERTSITCSRSRDVCTFGKTGLVSRHSSAKLSGIDSLTLEMDERGSRPLVLLKDAGQTPFGTLDYSAFDDQQNLERKFSKYLASQDEAFDEGYGPPVSWTLVVVVGLAAIAATIVLLRPRARIVVDPTSDVTSVTLYPRWGTTVPTTLEHARVRVTEGKVMLYDETGTSIDLPLGVSSHVVEALIDPTKPEPS